MSSPVDVVGIGAATWDDFWVVEDFSTEERVALALAHLSMGGGPVATALCTLSHLGHRCTLVDAQGDDAAGCAITKELTAAGVTTDHVAMVPGAFSTRATVLVRKRDGARQIVYTPATAPEPRWDAREDAALRGARLLHLNGRHEATARAAVLSAQRQGITISFDGGAGRYRDSIRTLVLASQLRLVAKDFARCFSDESGLPGMMEALLQPPAQIVVITDGLRGSWVAVPGREPQHVPACAAARTVDTTGCGDVYHGAFLHGWLRGWDPVQCAGYASVLAARNAEGLGGRFALSRRAVLEQPKGP